MTNDRTHKFGSAQWRDTVLEHIQGKLAEGLPLTEHERAFIKAEGDHDRREINRALARAGYLLRF